MKILYPYLYSGDRGDDGAPLRSSGNDSVFRAAQYRVSRFCECELQMLREITSLRGFPDIESQDYSGSPLASASPVRFCSSRLETPGKALALRSPYMKTMGRFEEFNGVREGSGLSMSFSTRVLASSASSVNAGAHRSARHASARVRTDFLVAGNREIQYRGNFSRECPTKCFSSSRETDDGLGCSK